MVLAAYVLIFLLQLTALTCDATSRNEHHLLFAVRADDDATAPSPAIHHRQQSHTAKVLSDHQNMDFHPAMMARRGEPTPPRPSPSVVEAASVRGALPPPSLFAMDSSDIEGAPPMSGKQDIISAAVDPSPRGKGASSEASAAEQESASDNVGVDYADPKTHPPPGPPRPAESINQQ